MKNIVHQIIIVFAGLLLACTGISAQAENPKFDKALADSLGADSYGMKMYVFVILKTGTAIIDDKETVAEIFTGHIDNIRRLADEGKLVVAGPLGKNSKSYRSFFILNAKSVEEAKTILKSDPAIIAKLLDTEMFTWYGSAALPAYIKTHEKIEKQQL